MIVTIVGLLAAGLDADEMLPAYPYLERLSAIRGQRVADRLSGSLH